MATSNIAPNAVETSDINDGAVDTNKLASSLDISGKTVTYRSIVNNDFNNSAITGSKLDNYIELKKQLCDTKIFETFSTEQDLNYLINKYKDSHYRTNKLNEQKEALAKIAGSYDSVITALNEL